MEAKKNWIVPFLIFFLLLMFSACQKEEQHPVLQPDSTVQIIGLKEHNNGNISVTLSISRDSLWSYFQKEKEKQQSKAQQKLVKEALTVFLKTEQALDFLEKGQTQQAEQVLKQILSELNSISQQYPTLNSVPIDASAQIFNLANDLKEIEKMRDQVKNLVDDGNFQLARRILNNMVNEIRVTFTNIPLKTYPTAIKKAMELIKQGQMSDAKQVLANALGSIELQEISIPLPVVSAQAMVALASESVDKDPQKAMDLLKDAQYQIQLAEALGYGNHDQEFKDILADIETIKGKIKKEENTAHLFTALKQRLQKFKERISK